jgi:hypothetical protein
MSSLVQELQRDALNGDVDVSSLLRKAYAVAVKLKLEKFKTWCEWELDGYRGQHVPNYRKLGGLIRAFNPMRGWIPAMFGDAELARTLATHEERCPVSAVHALLDGGMGDLIVTFESEIQNMLMQGSGIPMETSLHIGKAAYASILDAVRNTILKWSLELEADGILGEGMSFSPAEKEAAAKNADQLQSQVNFITVHSMVNSSIQQGGDKGNEH